MRGSAPMYDINYAYVNNKLALMRMIEKGKNCFRGHNIQLLYKKCAFKLKKESFVIAFYL